MPKTSRSKTLYDTYRFPGFTPVRELKGLFGDRFARVIRLNRRSKKTVCGTCGTEHRGWYDKRPRQIRDLSCGDYRIYLEVDVRRVDCRTCGKVRREGLEWLLDRPFCSKRFGYLIGEKCRSQTIQDVAREHMLDWHTVKELDKRYRTCSPLFGPFPSEPASAFHRRSHRANSGADPEG